MAQARWGLDLNGCWDELICATLTEEDDTPLSLPHDLNSAQGYHTFLRSTKSKRRFMKFMCRFLYRMNDVPMEDTIRIFHVIAEHLYQHHAMTKFEEAVEMVRILLSIGQASNMSSGYVSRGGDPTWLFEEDIEWSSPDEDAETTYSGDTDSISDEDGESKVMGQDEL